MRMAISFFDARRSKAGSATFAPASAKHSCAVIGRPPLKGSQTVRRNRWTRRQTRWSPRRCPEKKQQARRQPVRLVVLKTRRSQFTAGACSEIFHEVAFFRGRCRGVSAQYCPKQG